MPRQNRPHKTSGEVYETFRRIGKVGGNTVGGLVISGKIFNALWNQGVLTKDQIQSACDEAGVTTEEMESAFDLADKARADLGIEDAPVRSRTKRTAPKKQ